MWHVIVYPYLYIEVMSTVKAKTTHRNLRRADDKTNTETYFWVKADPWDNLEVWYLTKTTTFTNLYPRIWH